MADTMDVDESKPTKDQKEPRFGTVAAIQAKEFHKELILAVTFRLEEGFDTKAIDLLSEVSYAGISTPPKKGTRKEIAIPPPEILSIITTMSLHPNYTTRQTGLLELDTAMKASSYIRTIIRLAGATNCKLQDAWRFRRIEGANNSSDDNGTGTRKMRNRNVAKTGAAGRRGRRMVHEIDGTPFANLDIAQGENLFKRCDDIWAVIGWALVTSCCYKKRWDVWKDFLELLLETLEADFEERIEAADTAEEMDLEGSMINAIGLLPDLAGGAGYKRIVRAIFANGSERSRNEWVPVFPKETKKAPKTRPVEWKTKLDAAAYKEGKDKAAGDVIKKLNENAGADFKKFRNNVNDTSDAYQEFQDELLRAGLVDDADDESEDDEGIRGLKKEDKSKLESHEEAAEAWGGVESITIRLKLMALVSVIGACAELSNARRERLAADELKKNRKSRQRSKTPARQELLENQMANLLHTEKPTSTITTKNTLTEEVKDKTEEQNDASTSHPIPPALSSSSSDQYNDNNKYTLRYHHPTILSSLPHNVRNINPTPTPTNIENNDPNNKNNNLPQISWIFAWDTETLTCFHEEYTDSLRTLPIKQLTLFLTPTIYPEADPSFRATLLTSILQRSMVFQPRNGWTTDTVTDENLTEWYLPHYARGQDVESQVRMGMLVEYLARLWHLNAPGGKGWRWSEEMQGAVEAGIAVRREKAETALKRRKKSTEAEAELIGMLEMGENRLRILVIQAKTMTLKKK
ncbi:hypothetical protein TWF694_004914 [Orbilia ellipsospora]|uniref:Uncharacterized protein n=1 Tax=Orbilia ellipsospora TaxID=2528407 RepID=A0AAV9WV46_9PEZI